MEKIELEIIALSHSITQSHSYAVVLGEKSGARRLPIVIGGFEAQAIAVAIEKMAPSRPLTHDLMQNVCQSFNIRLKEVLIDNLVDGVFYAKLVCIGKEGKDIEIDSRTSDALALAVRFNCPIYTFEFIMDSAGIILEDTSKEKEPAKSKKASSKKVTTKKKKGGEEDLNAYSLEELNKLMQMMLEQENYEAAIKYRDEINKRKKKN